MSEKKSFWLFSKATEESVNCLNFTGEFACGVTAWRQRNVDVYWVFICPFLFEWQRYNNNLRCSDHLRTSWVNLYHLVTHSLYGVLRFSFFNEDHLLNYRLHDVVLNLKDVLCIFFLLIYLKQRFSSGCNYVGVCTPICCASVVLF